MISNPQALLSMFSSFGSMEEARYIALLSSPDYNCTLKRTGHSPLNKKPVQCIETGIIYDSFSAAAIAMTGRSSDANRIGLAVKKGQKFSKKHWRLAE